MCAHLRRLPWNLCDWNGARLRNWVTVFGQNIYRVVCSSQRWEVLRCIVYYKKLSKSLGWRTLPRAPSDGRFQRGGSGPEVQSLMCPRVGTDWADLRQSPPSKKRLRHTGNHLRQLLPVCCRHGWKRWGGSRLASDRSNPSRKHVGNAPRSHNAVGWCRSISSSICSSVKAGYVLSGSRCLGQGFSTNPTCPRSG